MKDLPTKRKHSIRSVFIPAKISRGAITAMLTSFLAATTSFGTEKSHQPTRFSSSFDQGFEPFHRHHSGTWEIKKDATGNPYASLIEEGKFEPPLRRPTAFLLLPEYIWTDVTLDIRARSTADMRLSGRDLVLLFGYVDALHFYYAHISNSNNGRTHNIIMKVDGTK